MGPAGALGESPCYASSRFWWAPVTLAFFGWQMHHTRLGLGLHMAFLPVCVSVSSVLSDFL